MATGTAGTLEPEQQLGAGMHQSEKIDDLEDNCKHIDDVAVYLTPKEHRKLFWRIDLRVVPMISFMYGVSVIDRGNIGQVYVAGLQKDLALVGAQYSVITLLFFPTYVLCSYPSNMMLLKVGAQLWLSFLLFGWGMIMLGMGFIQNWWSLAILRFFLGAFESGIVPAAIFMMASWYKPFELAKRVAVLIGTSMLANGFGGILAFAIAHMDGVGGYSGWRWIFIIEAYGPHISCELMIDFSQSSLHSCHIGASQTFLRKRNS